MPSLPSASTKQSTHLGECESVAYMNARREQRAAEEPRFQKLAEQRQEREEEIKKLNERQEAMTAEFHQLKKMTSELTERVVRVSVYIGSEHCVGKCR